MNIIKKNNEIEIINLAIKNNLLISPEVLSKITKEDISNILYLFKDKIEGSSVPLVVNNELFNLISKSKDKINLNWQEYEKSRVDVERGNNSQIYDGFLQILDTNNKHKRDFMNNSNEDLSENDLVIKDKNSQQSNVIILKSYNSSAGKRSEADFVKYYNLRYEAIKNILINRPDLKNTVSINKIGYAKGKISVIGLVMDKITTKNENVILTIDDPTGYVKIIVSKNKFELFQTTKDIAFDEVIGAVGSYGNGFLFAENIFFPDVPINNNLKKSEDEAYVAFISDIHVGSQKFLKQEFQTFIDWLNGKYGDQRQKEIASKVKYILIIGDTVAGVGVYPNQDEELEIKDILDQYKELANYLKSIRDDIKIVMCPGNHDATRVAEPQPPPGKDYAKDLYQIDNLLLVTNPCLINIHSSETFEGFNILMYHGASFHYYIDNVDRLRLAKARDNPGIILKFLLQKRHLAPSHGSTLLIPDVNNDFLVIDKIPDIMVSGDMHKSDVSRYNNVTLINCSCWESKTDFQEKTGNNPDPCKVPIINLKTREIKIMRFDKHG